MSMEPLRLMLIVGANLFGVYALFKICQAMYWFFKDKMSKRDEV